MKILIFLAVMVTVTLCQETIIDPNDGNSTDNNSTSTVKPVTSTVLPTTNTTDGNSTEPTAPTTISPNTTEPSNSSTPAASTTPAVTTPAPPPPDVETVNVTVQNSTVLCISMVAEMSLTFNSDRIVNVPANAQHGGNCSLSDSTQSLFLKFGDNMLTFIFSKDENDDVTISEIDIAYNDKGMKEQNVTGSFLKSGADGSYYLCNSNTTVATWDKVVLTTTNLKYKAFNTNMKPGFSDGTVTECPADEDTSSIVPIAVGAALAGLVIIVLIAYLIGRRRARQTGYESV